MNQGRWPNRALEYESPNRQKRGRLVRNFIDVIRETMLDRAIAEKHWEGRQK